MQARAGCPARSRRARRGRKPGRAEQCGDRRLLTDAELEHEDAAGLEQSRRLSRNGAIGSRARRRRRRARGAGSRRTSGASVAMSPLRDVGRIADTRSNARRSAPRRNRTTTNAARAAEAEAAALSRAAASASTLMSVPMPMAFGSSEQRQQQRARAGAEIGDAQRARARGRPHRSRPSAASTTVSVSGRGTSVAALRRSGRPQNSLTPRMRATGSRVEPPRRQRRPARAARASSRLRLASIVSAAWSRPSAWPTSRRASSSGESRPALAERIGQRAARLRDGHVARDSSGIRRLRPPAARPDAR